jgi:tRNA pseudouridine65 synthase
VRVEVLGRGERWAVVAKPSGVAVHQSRMVPERGTLIRAVRTELPSASPVHRLDRATSGCVLLSLDPAFTPALQAGLADGEKRYLAFVRGRMALDPVRVTNPMKGDDGVVRDAETLVTPVATTDDPRSSLVLAVPVTGRWHQVRRHLRDLDHPVLGDAVHGDTRVNRWWREERGLGRLGLHCLSLALVAGGEPVRATCPVPDDLRRVWQGLPWWDDAVRAVPELRFPATIPG